jgi:hypothetical protein
MRNARGRKSVTYGDHDVEIRAVGAESNLLFIFTCLTAVTFVRLSTASLTVSSLALFDKLTECLQSKLLFYIRETIPEKLEARL